MTMKVFMKVYLKSDVFVGVDFPGRVGNADVRLPVELQVDFGVFGVFVGDDRLTVVPGQSVAVVDVPHALAAGLVVLELAGVAGAVLEDPLAFVHLPLDPAADQLHVRVRVDVGALAVLLVELPPPRVAVAVRVHVGALAVLVAVLPLPVVLALASVGQLADSVLHVASEVALVLVPVGVDVLALAFAHAIVVLAVVLVVVGVNSIPPSGVVSGVLAFFSAFLGELVGLSFSLFCHQFQIIIIDKFKLINHF